MLLRLHRVSVPSCVHLPASSATPWILARRDRHTDNKHDSPDTVARLVRGAYRAHGESNLELLRALQRHGVLRDPRVLDAMDQVDRGLYVAPAYRLRAYVDQPVPLALRQTLSAAHMHALALQRLVHVLPRDPEASAQVVVLDVGAGSGYLSACLAALVAPYGRVVAIERLAALAERARENIARANPELSPRITIVHGDGWHGHSACAPYTAIHVGAAAETLPSALVSQLASGGRLLVPVGAAGVQQLVECDKRADGSLVQRTLLNVDFVPLVRDRPEHSEHSEHTP